MRFATRRCMVFPRRGIISIAACLALTPLLRQHLEACLATSARFYEAVDCEAGLTFRARDVFTSATYAVSEALASTSLKRGDIFYVYLIPLGQITLMEAISPQSFPQECKRHLLYRDRPARENGGLELRQIYIQARRHSSRKSGSALGSHSILRRPSIVNNVQA